MMSASTGEKASSFSSFEVKTAGDALRERALDRVETVRPGWRLGQCEAGVTADDLHTMAILDGCQGQIHACPASPWRDGRRFLRWSIRYLYGTLSY